MTGVVVPSAVEDLWRVQAGWSTVASRMKKRIERARTLALLLAVTAAVCGASSAALVSSSDYGSRGLAGAAALSAGLLPLLRTAASGKAVRDWTRARAVSEALKSQVYLWLSGAGPYREDAEARLLRRSSDQIREDGADLLAHHLKLSPPSRPLPEVHDAASYFRVRVEGQIEGYYRPRAEQLAVRSATARRFEVGISVLGALVGAVAASRSANVASWIAVLTTIGTALAVHVAAARYDYQLVEFLATANRLSRLRDDAAVATSAAELDSLVVAAEEAILAENKGWMAKLTDDPPKT